MKVNDLVDKIQKYSEDADIRMIVDAYLYSAQSHTGQKRKSGEAYLTHSLVVAGILADLKMDVDTIATGLLHDTMEDCLVTHEDISACFGIEVADLVDGVTKIGIRHPVPKKSFSRKISENVLGNVKRHPRDCCQISRQTS